jgi:microsomal dipeptidase-like Zn-dependent dipeptidase
MHIFLERKMAHQQITKVLATLSVSVGLALVATEADAEIRTAYVWADKPSVNSYSPNSSYAVLPAGSEIQRTGVGIYRVNLRGFMPAAPLGLAATTTAGRLGNVQVSAYGDAGNFCQIASWGETANILCFNSDGRPVDTQFSMLATIAAPGDGIAYVWAGRPGEPEYTARSAYGLSPSGDITIKRRGAGRYNVMLGGSIVGVGGHLQVSAYGGDPRQCRIVGWIAGLADIMCTDISGRPADSAFSVLAINPAADDQRFAFAWGNDPDTVNYEPDGRYVHAPEMDSTIRITRRGVGRYQVPLGTRINQVQVSAYGANAAYCNPVSWSPSSVNIACFASGGAPTNTRFTVLAVNRDSVGLRIVDPRLDRRPPGTLPLPVPAGPAGPVAPSEPPPPLFGYADLHTHPASFLGFGGTEDGRKGMMWGRPAVGEAYRDQTARERFQAGVPKTHARSSDDMIQEKLREVIIGSADGRTNLAHARHGADSFETWPNSMLVSHQQIDVDWLRRAHAGGLRVIVASAVDNEIVDTTYDWSLGNLLSVADPFFRGEAIRDALGMPDPEFSFNVARQQLEFINLMVDENRDFMEIALSGADARRIVEQGKLAVILGLELDTLSPAQFRDLIENFNVRLVTPIHFVDNEIGAAAAYEFMFSLLSGILGSDGQPYSLIPDENLDFFINQELGDGLSELNRLTASTLGWEAIGEACPASSRAADGRLGCIGRRNRDGLTPEGVELMNWMLGMGVFIDLAHMSQNSQITTLELATAKQCPVVNTHSDIRPDAFEYGATERQMLESLARDMLAQGGVFGLGTGLAEAGNPRRIFYNAGNPLIDLRKRSNWTLDLRQSELQQTIPAGAFSQYRVTLRIGKDDLHSSNTVTGRLLSASGMIDECILANSTEGVSGYGEKMIICSLSRRVAIGEVDGFWMGHNGVGGISGDNVDIDELVVEANIGTSGSPDWLTLIQRVGGDEGPVYRLKGRAPDTAEGTGIFGSDFFVTRLLPRADELLRPGEVITGLRVRTFTNEDDLDGAGPGALTAKLSGYRHSGTGGDLRTQFGAGGISNGTFTQSDIIFESGAETLITDIEDRAAILTFGGLTLTTGTEEVDDALVAMINNYRSIARGGGLGPEELLAGLGAIAPGVIGLATSATGWAMVDPFSAGLASLFIYMELESYDNWSTNVAVHVLVDTDGRAGGASVERPFLVGYNPTQRLRRDTNVSTLFENLPERIESDRPYGGMVVNYNLINDGGDDWISGNDLEFTVTFNDNISRTRKAALNVKLKVGKDYSLVIPFDRLRRGNELKSFEIRVVGRSSILFRQLDVGLVKDPMQSWMEEFNKISELGDFAGQIAIGTDLSGFEALTPFSAIRPGPFRASALTICPPGRGATTGPCTPSGGTTLDPVLFSGRPLGSGYRLDIEDIAGRSDPARTNPALATASELSIASINSSRQLDFRETGLSTVGQLPELAAAAHHADQLFGTDGPASLGPELFNSVDALVRAWERLDVAEAAGRASGDPASARCMP